MPPDSLTDRLVELRLCTAADVRRARGAVRRMTRDLPAFDSVWIDALAHIGALTPFQARCLETSPAETLVVGDYVLLDGLGAGVASHSFLAADVDRRRKVVLKRLTPPTDQLDAIENRLDRLVDAARAVRTPHASLAAAWIRHRDSLFVISPFVPGRSLAELLVRRGRFPPSIVLLIADQLFSALAPLHAAGLAHGDVRGSKLRLTDGGTLVLVDGGVCPAVSPELLVHSVASPDAADVIAPERIGTNLPATAATDLYAAGCVLWQLLAGRPPYPHADPLTKLAAHQTRRIADVRELAPDTPPRLAELINSLTAPNPQDRPQSAETARRLLGVRGAVRHPALARFGRQFELTVPHLARRTLGATRAWHGLTAGVLLLALAAVLLSDQGRRAELLQIAQRSWPGEKAAHPSPLIVSEFLEIPAPDARGVITLTGEGPYVARDLAAAGPLTLRGKEGSRPTIRLRGEPLRIAAQRVLLKDVDFVLEESGSPSGPEALLELRTQRLLIDDCRFRSARPFAQHSQHGAEQPFPAAIRWEPLDPRDPQAGLLEVVSTVFAGEQNALDCSTTPRQIAWRNVLKGNRGAGVIVRGAPSARRLILALEHVTLRGAGPLVSCAGPLVEQASAAGIEVEAVDCVLDAAAPSPLVELRGPKVRDDWPTAIRVLGDGSLLPPGAVLLSHVDDGQGIAAVLESDELQFEGLFPDAYEFAGPLSDDPRDSALVKTQAPRRQTDQMPGIDPRRFSVRPQTNVFRKTAGGTS